MVVATIASPVVAMNTRLYLSWVSFFHGRLAICVSLKHASLPFHVMAASTAPRLNHLARPWRRCSDAAEVRSGCNGVVSVNVCRRPKWLRERLQQRR